MREGRELRERRNLSSVEDYVINFFYAIYRALLIFPGLVQ
jgi:hypothetical protein